VSLASLKRAGTNMRNQTPIVQAARVRALDLAQGEATRAKIFALDGTGRSRADIAAAFGLVR
jgi:hypothetical protein